MTLATVRPTARPGAAPVQQPPTRRWPRPVESLAPVRRERGVVALEFALLLPLMALLLFVVLQVLGVARDVLVVQDLARQGARRAAVADDAEVHAVVQHRLPAATVRIIPPDAGPGRLVTVEVGATTTVAGRPFVVTGRGTAMVEPGRR